MRNPLDTLVPPCRYRLGYDRCEEGRAFGETRLFAHFRISEEGEFFGFPLVRFYNLPRGPFLARSSNLALDFMAVVGDRPPSQGLQPDDFLKGCEVLGEVVTVTEYRKGKRRIQRPENCHWSKINGLGNFPRFEMVFVCTEKQPTPGSSRAEDPYQRLRRLKELLDDGVTSQVEFDREKDEILRK